jgi:hypothetical protein
MLRDVVAELSALQAMLSDAAGSTQTGTRSKRVAARG